MIQAPYTKKERSWYHMISSIHISMIGIILLIISAIYRMVEELMESKTKILRNLFVGGVMFSLLNFLGFSIHLNIINSIIIILLGLPGIVLIVVLKILWMMI